MHNIYLIVQSKVVAKLNTHYNKKNQHYAHRVRLSVSRDFLYKEQLLP